MWRHLLLLVDAVLVVAAGFLAVRLGEVWPTTPVVTLAPSTPAAATGGALPPASPPARPAARPALTTYAVVAERNLFGPSRSEAPPEPPRPQVAAAATPPPPRPRLHGVVLFPDGRSRAYLEDVQRRKVFAYSAGDSVAGSLVEQIRADRVVLRRGAETFEVLLRDPSKPRPAPVAPAPPGPASRPGIGAVPGGPRSPTLTPGVPAPPIPLPPTGIRRRPPVPRGATSEPERPEPPDPGPPGNPSDEDESS